VTLTPEESAMLRALIYSAPAAAVGNRHAPEARALAEEIVSWFYTLPLARGDLDAIRATAARALEAELERQLRTTGGRRRAGRALPRSTYQPRTRRGVADAA
jgi:hypothetical protein